MISARREVGGCGTQAAGLCIGGNPNAGGGGNTTATEEFTGGNAIITFTTS
jgi:hypothetical protein